MNHCTLKRAALALCATACLTASAAASAADAAPPPVLKALEARGASGWKEFKAGGDLRGFAGVAGTNPVTVYVTRDGSAVLGMRVDAQGEPMDKQTVDELVAKPLEEAAWRGVEATRWVRDGRADAPRVVYVFTDANCPWCHRFFDAAKPWVDAGKVQLRQIYVGVIRADSAAKAAAILEAPDPVEAARRNERDFDKGGIAPLKTIPEATRQLLAADLQLMDSLGFRGTPGILWHGPDGRLKTLGGFPQGDRLAEVLGPR